MTCVSPVEESYITFVSQLDDTAGSIVDESQEDMDTSTRTVATLVDTSISSAGSQDLPESLNTPVSHSTTHVTPALAARPPPPAVIRPIFSPRVPKAFSSQKELTYESKYAQSELVVKRSLVQVDGHFTEQGLYRGWGLFTPSQHRSRGMCVSVYVCVCVCATVADRMHVCVHNVHVLSLIHI